MTVKRINRGRGHSYIIDGKKAVGVTTVLSKGWPQHWMGPWAAKCVAQEGIDMDPEDMARLRARGRDYAIDWLKRAPYRLRDTAAVRGTKVHTLAEKISLGEEVEVPDELFGHVESAVAFLDEWNIRPLLVEKTVASYAYGYAGTFDLIADIPDGRRVLLDYKTSSSIKETTALQLAAYRYADFYLADNKTGLEIPMREVGIDACMAVHLRADGYDVVPLDTSPDVFTAFLACLRVAAAHEASEAWVQPPLALTDLEITA